MTISDEITIIANQLANQGKKPTVALIKSKLTKSVPLTEIIKVLKHWQHDENFTELAEQPLAQQDKQQTITELEQAINQGINQALAPIKIELATIKAELAALKKSLNNG